MHAPLKTPKRRACGGERLATLLVVLLVTTAARAEVINKILATVDGEPVTLHELNTFVDSNIRGRQLSASLDRSAMLEQLITEKVVQKEVSDRGIVVQEEDINRYLEGIKQRNNNISDEQLKEALAAQGVTLESYRNQIREEIQRQQLIAREIRGKVSITPEEIQRYYEAHREEFSTPERIEVAHILFRLSPDASSDQVAAATAKAEAVSKQLKDGADFAALAAQYSEDGSGKDGGSLGWFKRGELLDGLEKAAVQLKVGEVSPPVRTKVGIHILKLEGREDASSQNLDELAEQIKQQLYTAAMEERFQKWLTEELRQKHHVELLQ
jgi:peptidyl-prolyl cis-trans isomerase SurA